MVAQFAENAQACVATSGQILSMLEGESWAKCFVDFFYGDGLPNMKERGERGNLTVHVPMCDALAYLQDREELEYQLPSDKATYKAKATSRFDTPEFTATFGSVLRYEAILRGVNVTFRRQGYEADLKMIANANPDECVDLLCSGTSKRSAAQPAAKKPAKTDRQRSLDELAYAADVPRNLQAALKQVLFAQADVPFTDGYRRRLRHEGHNLNVVHGPLKLFVTANFADVYSPILLSMVVRHEDGSAVGDPIEVRRPNLAEQAPTMCTLQQMHRLVAASPRAQAKFWLLCDDLVDRFLLGIGHYYIGRHRNDRLINYDAKEDDYCSSGELGLAGFAVNEEEPCEAQARGFTHGHRKVYGIPEPLGPEILRQFESELKSNQDEQLRATSDIDDDATSSSALRGFLAKITQALVDCACTVQYEAATLPAKQMKQEVPPDKFTRRQQELSRLDGGKEIDDSERRCLPPTVHEPLGHLADEEEKALLGSRPTRNAYSQVPLTGCQNSLLPTYRQPHVAFQQFPTLDEFGRHVNTTEETENLPTRLPWRTNEDGETIEPIATDGTAVTVENYRQDATRFALAFCRDSRALHGHNHDHNCGFTCIKYIKQKAKNIAEKSLDTGTNIVCRFFFYTVLARDLAATAPRTEP